MSNSSIARFRAARSDKSLCVLEGLHAIKHAMRFQAEIVQICGNSAIDWRALVDELAPDIRKQIEQNCAETSPDVFNQLCPQPPHTGLVALAKRPPFDPPTLLKPGRTAPLVILDNPAHPGNTGAVIRTAAAAGASAVLTTGAADPWHPTTVRASAGLHFALPVGRIDTGDLQGLALTGLDADGEPLTAGDLHDESVLVFGSERSGLSGAMRERLERSISLPMRPGVSSLNLAASVAILLYQWRLHRGAVQTER